MCQQGTQMTSACMYLEILPNEYRFYGECFALVAWTTGVVIIAPIAFLLQNYSWRITMITVALISFFSLAEYWLLHESLRWLLANGKVHDAEKLIRKAAKLNQKSYDDIINQVEMQVPEKEPLNEKQEERIAEILNCTDAGYLSTEKITFEHLDNKYNDYPLDEDIGKRLEDDSMLKEEMNEPLDDKDGAYVLEEKIEDDGLLERTITSDTVTIETDQQNSTVPDIKQYTILSICLHKRLLFTSIVLWFSWITNSLTYYGLMLVSSTLSGDRFMNYFLLSIIEYPSAVVEILAIPRLGRRGTTITFQIVTAFSLAVATTLKVLGASSTTDILTTIFALIGKFGITISFSAVFMYAPELYPTNLRNAGHGLSSTAARLGGMLAPFAELLALRVLWAPGAIFATMCLLSSLMISLLPETSGHNLPTTLEELDDWYKQHKRWWQRSPKHAGVEMKSTLKEK